MTHPTPSLPRFCSQRTVSFVWRLKNRRRRSHRPGTQRNTPPDRAVSGKSELRKKTPYSWLSHSFTSRMTAPMTLWPSTILWAQTSLRPSQSKWTGTRHLFKPFTGTGPASWFIHTAGKSHHFSCRSSLWRTCGMGTSSEFADCVSKNVIKPFWNVLAAADLGCLL